MKDADWMTAILVSSGKFSRTSFGMIGDRFSCLRSAEGVLRFWAGFLFDNLFSFESLPHIRTDGIQVVFM